MQGATHRLLPEVVSQLQTAAGRDPLVDHVDLGGHRGPTHRLGQETHGPDPSEPVGRQRSGERGIVLLGRPTNPGFHPAPGRGGQHPGHLGRSRSRTDPDDQVGMGPVAMHVRLAEQARRITVDAVVAVPPLEIGGGHVVGVHLGQVTARRPRAQLQQVVGATSLGAVSHRGPLPPAERLALHDGPGDPPVDVRVTHLDGVQPAIDLIGIQRVDAAGEPVVHRVLHGEGLVQVGHGHQAQHRSEHLGPVERRARAHPDLDARRPVPTRPTIGALISHTAGNRI